jgi:signal transduction histidine kinase
VIAPHASAADAVPTARDAIELLAGALSGEDLDRDRFYSRLAEGMSRLARLRRVVIFRYDELTRRVEAAGSHGLDLALFVDLRVGLEAAPDGARALAEDRVIEVRPPAAHAIPPEFAQLIGDHPLIYVPMVAGDRWPGVIIAEPLPGSAPLDEPRSELLWMIGKTLALASTARTATSLSERARELQHRIDLARDIHERVVQRLFGVSMALSPPGILGEEARERCAEEVQTALGELRAALGRPLGAQPRPTRTTLTAELERWQRQAPDLAFEIDGSVSELPLALEPLLQSVLNEAVRNVVKHARARRVAVRLRRSGGLVVLEVENDGLDPARASGTPGVGLRIAALEAMQAGGLLEFGQRSAGTWRVRLAVAEPEA